MIDDNLNDLPDLHAFRLLQRIGRGGFADVYLARQEHLDMLVAIKLLHNRLDGEDKLDSFRQEARLIAQLEHPHIVRVLDFGIVEHTPYLVMNYASGGTLRQRVPRGSCVPLPQVVEYVSQVADALQCAHQHHVVHRDVKPENILFGRHGQLLLSDFGIAIMVQDPSSEGHHVAGTAAYMAPEQVQRRPEPASDQYALAVIAYEWLCGERPFQGSSTQTMLQHLSAPPPSFPPSLAIPQEVEHVIHKALAKEPTERFTSVLEFAQALRKASALPASAFVAVPDQYQQDQQIAHLETTVSDVNVAALTGALYLSPGEERPEHTAIFPLQREAFGRGGVLVTLVACVFPLLLLLPTLIGDGALYSYLNENQLPSLCLLAWLLLIGPVLGSRRAPLVVAFVYSLVLTPLLLQGRIPLFTALGTTLAQIVITAGAGAWQERKIAYQFLSSLLLTLVSMVASISLNSFIFRQPLYCPFISISISHPTSLTILPIAASLLAASLEWIVSTSMPSLRRLPLPQVKAQQHRSDIHDQRTQ
ncbi:serine/threonine protein kinase [Ktedonobacter racemifer]|uniref:non-specific serine/threonine protein kinase n=1 Tax=Ktedonobacter racemifer DSM 44963 TaxID=485913 RepID=D6U1H3_KTERA|nr:serine/threonine-protein kinase [Ktedonobacter racemifer]EFH82617.1 serine/threonine protein kinase [Ktedonobacter racemifer DSM 44963]